MVGVFEFVNDWSLEAIVGAVALVLGWIGRNFKDSVTKNQIEVQTAHDLIRSAMDLKEAVTEEASRRAIEWDNERQQREERLLLVEQHLRELQAEYLRLEGEVQLLREQLTEARVAWIKTFGDEPHWLGPSRT